MKRILTLQVEILDEKECEWIWDSHLGDYSQHGIYIQVI